MGVLFVRMTKFHFLKLTGKLFLGFFIITLFACAPETHRDQAGADHEVFFENLKDLCGQSFQGRLVSDDAVDADFAKAQMIMHVRDCTLDTVRIPFHVDDNRSRTWVITKSDRGLKLEHDHRHIDGEPDAVTLYGGDTIDGWQGSETGNLAGRQVFPVNQYSKDLFIREGLNGSVTNIWSLELKTDKIFAYELRRTNRHFRVEFDLSQPVATPPPAWGY